MCLWKKGRAFIPKSVVLTGEEFNEYTSNHLKYYHGDTVGLSSLSKNSYEPVDDDSDLTITHVNMKESVQSLDSVSLPHIPNDDIIVKKEVFNLVTTKIGKNKKFISEEDEFWKAGLKKYGPKSWASIFKDQDFHFQPSRTRDALRMGAESRAFKNYFVKI